MRGPRRAAPDGPPQHETAWKFSQKGRSAPHSGMAARHGHRFTTGRASLSLEYGLAPNDDMGVERYSAPGTLGDGRTGLRQPGQAGGRGKCKAMSSVGSALRTTDHSGHWHRCEPFVCSRAGISCQARWARSTVGRPKQARPKATADGPALMLRRSRRRIPRAEGDDRSAHERRHSKAMLALAWVPLPRSPDPTESQRACPSVPPGALTAVNLTTPCPLVPRYAPGSRDLEIAVYRETGIEGSNPSRSAL